MCNINIPSCFIYTTETTELTSQLALMQIILSQKNTVVEVCLLKRRSKFTCKANLESIERFSYMTLKNGFARSVSVRCLFYQPLDEKIKTWPLRFPTKKNLI